jgi:YHS domain-containing protein
MRLHVATGGMYGLLGALILLSGPAPTRAATARTAGQGTVATPPKATPTPPRPAYPKLVYEKVRYDSALSLNDRCPVKGGRLTPSIRPTYVNRQPVGYCCHSCPLIFSEDPAPYLKKLGITVRDPVYPARMASYEPRLRVFLNQEIYYFSGKDAMRRFESDPIRFSGPLTDPISQKRFQPTPRSPKAKYQGRTYYFESNLTQRQFAVAPKDYAKRREN